jgi:hypothetical protein
MVTFRGRQSLVSGPMSTGLPCCADATQFLVDALEFHEGVPQLAALLCLRSARVRLSGDDLQRSLFLCEFGAEPHVLVPQGRPALAARSLGRLSSGGGQDLLVASTCLPSLRGEQNGEPREELAPHRDGRLIDNLRLLAAYELEGISGREVHKRRGQEVQRSALKIIAVQYIAVVF